MTDESEKDIPQEWIREYARRMLEMANDSESDHQEIVALRRASYAADLVEAFRESQKGK